MDYIDRSDTEISQSGHNPHAGILIRERVAAALEDIFLYPLTAVSAMAGSGKTIAVRDFLRRKPDVKTVWLPLIASEGSAAYLWIRLSSRIGKISPECGRALSALGFPDSSAKRAEAVNILSELEDLGNVVLVFDDYQVVASPEVDRLMELFIYEQLPRLHIVIITAGAMGGRFESIRYKGLCLDINAEILDFNRGEIRRLMELMGLPADEGEAEAAYELTGGWAAGVHIMLKNLKTGTQFPIEMDKFIDRHLFAALDDERKEFLLRLSSLDGFSIREAEEILEDENAGALISDLAGCNAFVEKAPKATEFRIRRVLMIFLRNKQRETGRDNLALSRRAGLWHMDNGSPARAAKYMISAGDHDAALSILDDYGIPFLDDELIRELRAVFLRQPPDSWIKYPILFLRLACTLIFSGQEKSIALAGDILYTIRAYYEGLEPGVPEYREKVLGEIELISAFSAFNDAELMADFAHRAYELLEGGPSKVVSGKCDFTFGSPMLLYNYYKNEGGLRETVERLTERFPVFARLSDGLGTGLNYLVSAEYGLETMDLSQVKINGYRADFYANNHDQVWIRVAGMLTALRMYIYEGKKEDFQINLGHLRQLARSGGNPALKTAVDICEGYLWACIGDYNSVPKWLRQGKTERAGVVLRSIGLPTIVYCKAQFLRANWLHADIECEYFERDCGVYTTQLGRIHNQINKAIARFNATGADEGVSELLGAIKTAETDGIIFPFAESAGFILPMLELLTEEYPEDLFIGKILEHSRVYEKNLLNFKDSFYLLSEKEVEVLKHLAGGRTRDEIAKEMFVSVSTVKTHLLRMYKKLEVNNKVKAIERAREFGII